MCGIAGIYHYRDGSPASPELLKTMTRMIAHRGPDGDGFFFDGPVALGHRRLAIIDLETGAQPMAGEDGAVQLVFNGEIYNYADFVDDLKARGHVFATKSDTEVVIHAFEDSGLEAFTPFRGMFALALWDRRHRRLTLVRDRLGVKPLYYADLNGRLIFGSEIKALLADPELPRDIDGGNLAAYLGYGFVPGHGAMLAAVRQVPPGHALEVTRDGITIRRWWNFEARDAGSAAVPEAELLERLEAHLAETVRLRMVSDVPVGAFLSGGIDSGLVTALMARQSDAPVKTFSIGFDFEEFDERPYARRVAEAYGTDHEELLVKPDVLEILPRLVWHYDDPFADASMIPTYCVSEIAARRVTVALSGDGGDEGFGGYRRYVNALADGYADRLPGAVRGLFGAVAERLPDTARGKNRLRWLSRAGDDRYAEFFRGTPPHIVARHLAGSWKREAEREDRGDLAFVARIFADCPFDDPLARMQYFDARLYLSGDILPKVDRASMAHSLESREPLLDHLVMEFGLNLPRRLRIDGRETKMLLRKLALKLLPEDVVNRPKHGFSVPMDRWLRTDLKAFRNEILLDDQTRRRGWLDPAGVEKTLAEHDADQALHGATVWGLLMLELWARRYLDGPLDPPPAPPPRAEFLETLRRESRT